MNDGHGFPGLPDAVVQGLTTEAAIDAALSRSLTQLFRAGLFDDPANVAWTQIGAEAIASAEHARVNHDAALQAARAAAASPY